MSERVLLLEERLANAWPALETRFVDGWVLRFADRYSKRANSAAPFVAGAALDEALVRHIVDQFGRRRIRPVFRLTGIEAPSVDPLLAACGLMAVEPSLCLAGPVAAGDDDPAIRIEPAASPAWIEAAAGSYGGDKADHVTLGAIVSRISNPAGFATLVQDGQAIAWGLAVAERGFVGLYDIVVAPQARGRGAGRRIVSALLAWGARAGAHTAYLQVREENAPACRLYGSLGLTQAYRYTHRAGAVV